jgi:hypothetical protein
MNLSILHAGLLTAGACAVALPILIHILLRRRRTPVAWGAMRFILEAYQQQRKKSRLEQILLLLCRCLLVACIGAAIARPFFPANSAVLATGPQTLVMLIDNSVASGAMGSDGKSALDGHLAQAAKLVAGLDAARGDRVGVITLASPAEPLVWPPSTDLGAVSRIISTINPQASGADVAGGLARARELPSSGSESQSATSTNTQQAHWVVLSEFRAGSLDIGTPPPAAGIAPAAVISISPAATSVLGNVTIADASLLEPMILLGTGAGREEEMSPGGVRVTLIRSGTLAQATSTVRVSLGVAGAVQDDNTRSTPVTTPVSVPVSTPISWGVGVRQQVVTVPTPRAVLSTMRNPVLTISIDRDALELDNTYTLPIVPRELLTVGFVAPAVESSLASLGTRAGVEGFSSADWMYLAIEPSGSAEGAGGGTSIRRVWIEPGSLATMPLSDVEALVVAAPHALTEPGWRTLATFLDRGGVVLIVPSASTPVQVWSDAISTILGSPVTMSREPLILTSGGGVVAPDPAANRADPLTLLRSELTPLLNPVTVNKLFVLSPDPTVRVLLSTAAINGADGKVVTPAAPLLVALDRVGAARGGLYLFTAATVPDWTDLPARPLFVPLVQEVLRQGLGASSTPLVQRAGTALMAPPGTMSLSAIKGGNATYAVSPRGATLEPVRSASIFTMTDQRGLTLGVMATVPDAAATNLNVQDGDAVRTAMVGALGLTDTPQRVSVLGENEPSVQAAQKSDDAGNVRARRQADEASANHSRISMWLFAVAAILAVLDLLMGRWFSHASIRHTKSALDTRVVLEKADVPAADVERAA